MCEKIERLFDGLAVSAMRPTERKWSERLRTSYVQHGHLSPRQYQVLRDIHHRRCSSSSDRFCSRGSGFAYSEGSSFGSRNKRRSESW